MRTEIIHFITVGILVAHPFVCSANDKASSPESKANKPAVVAKKAATRLPDHLVRDPFWPIGTQPPGWGQEKDEKKEIEGLKQWSEAAKKLKISGISKDSEGNFFAVIRDIGVVETGDVISVDFAGLSYSWRIKNITKKGLTPVKMGVAPAK